MSEQSVTISGNVANEPELRFTPSGQPVCNFSVAVNKRVKNGDEWEDKLEGFFNVVAFKPLAENVAESLQKGSRVVVTGRLQQRSWEQDNGQKRSVIEVVAEDVGLSLKWTKATASK